MPIYRIVNPNFGERHLREWRRGVLHTVVLLLAALAVCAAGLVALDNTDAPITAKLFRAAWNATNLLTTLGDFMRRPRKPACRELSIRTSKRAA